MKSAITYFPAEQYHRQTELHFCVRDGNRCFPRLIVTDKRLDELSPTKTVVHDVAYRGQRSESSLGAEPLNIQVLDGPASHQAARWQPGMGAWWDRSSLRPLVPLR
jgi:hypothetical protein